MEEECINMEGTLLGSVIITDNATVRCITNDEEGIYVTVESQSITISGDANVYANAQKEGLDAYDIEISGGTVADAFTITEAEAPSALPSSPNPSRATSARSGA